MNLSMAEQIQIRRYRSSRLSLRLLVLLWICFPTQHTSLELIFLKLLSVCGWDIKPLQALKMQTGHRANLQEGCNKNTDVQSIFMFMFMFDFVVAGIFLLASTWLPHQLTSCNANAAWPDLTKWEAYVSIHRVSERHSMTAICGNMLFQFAVFNS